MELYVAHPDDIEAIQEIARTSWEHDYPDTMSRESVESAVNDWYGREQLHEALEDPWTHIHIARTNDQTVGFAHAVLDGNQGYLLRLYVHPDARRQGIGAALYDRVRAELVRHDIDQLNGMVLEQNDLGNEFYADRGLELTEQTETQIGDESYVENTYTVTLS